MLHQHFESLLDLNSGGNSGPNSAVLNPWTTAGLGGSSDAIGHEVGFPSGGAQIFPDFNISFCAARGQGHEELNFSRLGYPGNFHGGILANSNGLGYPISPVLSEEDVKYWLYSERGLSLDTNMPMSSLGAPQSPLDMKPDTSLLSSGAFSPGTGAGQTSPRYASSEDSLPQASFSLDSNFVNGLSNGSSGSTNGNSNGVSPTNGQFPPNHPLSGSKHLCSICGDRASGKHYGVYSCEGCKGFFKRTVRKDLTYACREDKSCVIDKRHRNRCQYCRYQKCLSMGMKREAVQYLAEGHSKARRRKSSAQEERQRTRERSDSEVESTSTTVQVEMQLERIIEAERKTELRERPIIDTEIQGIGDICQAADKQLFQLVEWAKHVPHFNELSIADRVLILKSGWNELLIIGVAHRSLEVKDSLVLANGLTVHRNTPGLNGVGLHNVFERILSEVVVKLRDLKVDKAELGCMKAIILFNPDARGLSQASIETVEALRDKVYATLEEYTRSTFPSEPGRFAKLLLRLPALRSIGLRVEDHLFFYRLIDTPIDKYLRDRLGIASDN